MQSFVARVRLWWRGLRRPTQLEQDMDDEMRFHVEMYAERLMREQQLGPEEAHRRARIAFGAAERYKGQGRDARGLTRAFDISLDLKLAVRTLAKYPVVSIVGGLALAIGIALGAAYLEIVNDFLHPTLPLDEGERIVGLQNWDLSANKPELRSVHDFVAWRGELESVEALGAFRSIERNLGVADAPAEPALGAAITASAFPLARVPALLGRTLIASDELAGAPSVVVLGHQLWRSRFFGDHSVVGRTIQLGNEITTVVGVMPEGFAFPVSHQFWVPLRVNALSVERRQGPPIQMFGRLAPGVTRDEANVELSALGLRAAADAPATHERLRPRVVNYTELFVGGGSGGGQAAYLVEFVFVLLVILLSSNVATMVFARTAIRENEIAMRFALGSSRGRILGQFFVEALVLSLAATVVGLTVVAWGTQWVTRLVWQVAEGQSPFWLDSHLNVTTVLYALGLAVLGSLVAGVMPAMKVTGSRLQSRLRHSAGPGDSGLRFGGLWSGVIVAQVTFAVLVLPPAIVSLSSMVTADYADAGFAGHEYIASRLEMDLDRVLEFETTYEELGRRLLANADIAQVTFANRLPGMNHPQPSIALEGDDGALESLESDWVMPAAVDARYFDAFGATIVAGRGFTAADRGSRVVVVNQDFVADRLRGRNAIGRRIRYQTQYGQESATGEAAPPVRARALETGPWFEIIGVVSNVGMDTSRDPFHSGVGPGIYHPLTPQAVGSPGAYSVRMALHARGDRESIPRQLRHVAYAVHPGLRVYDVSPMDGPVDRAARSQRLVSDFFTSITVLVAVVALLISTAGTYSVMSFTVSRQTRDIGIRIALGADRRRIITGVFSRAMAQITAGILVGALIWVYVIVFELRPANETNADDIRLLLTSGAVLMFVGLIACGVPVSRALRIQPTEALRTVD